MTPQELAICREIHNGLTSQERNNVNYLFLDPVDTSIFTDYLQIIEKPMDLRTLKENLDGGAYSTKEAFYADARLIFDNAIKFNTGRESDFVLTLARSMNKAFEKLRKTAERKAARAACESGGGSKQKGKDGDKKEGGEKKKKINIKLKRQKSTASVGDISMASSNDSAPGAGGGAGGEASAATTESAAKPKKAKTKLKLKLSAGSDSKKGDNASKKSKSKSSTTPKSSSGGGEFLPVPMTTNRRAQCSKVISSLKRRQPTACKQWFHKPVSDPAIVKDYREKISNPMDMSTLSSK